MRRLNGVDAIMLYAETPEIHMHTLKIGIIDLSGFGGRFDFDAFRKGAYRRLMDLPPLRYQLVDIPMKLHHPMWALNRDIDLDYHLRRVAVAAPGGRRELDQLIGDIASTPLDRNHPMWEMYIVEGLADDRVAIVHKVHHALADGVASANQMARALQPVVRDAVVQRKPDSDLGTAGLVKEAGRDHLRQIRRLPTLIGRTGAGVSRVRRRSKERGDHPQLARAFAPPPCFINHVVSPVRRFATTPLALADVKELSKHLGVTLNDIVLATAAGALRELLLRHDGRADSPLIAGVPVSYDKSLERLSGNEITYMMPSLPVHIDDSLERVRLTSLATGHAKEDHHLLGPDVMPSWLAYLPPLLTPGLRWQSSRMDSSKFMNLTVSNVAGPRERGRLGDAYLSEIYSVGPLIAGSGMNITVWSYVDQLNISVLTDDVTLDDAHEATDALRRAFIELRSAAGLSDVLTDVGATMPLAGAG